MRKKYPYTTYLVLLVMLLGAIPTETVFGLDSTFRIQTLVGDETTPPSIPTSLMAIPVATSQIDLAWGSSTDNTVLAGYHVWRGSFLIATTTVTTYIDTGLTPSTTYSYYVTAFDSSGNESASSSVVATTTLSIIATTTEDISTEGTSGGNENPFRDILSYIEVLPDKNAVTIRYDTRQYIRAVVKWGRTSSYELGSLMERAFLKKHETIISGLSPETRYWFTIEGEHVSGRYKTIYSGSFSTLPEEDVSPPGNVTGLVAVKDGPDIALSWRNPNDSDFSKVRVVRSDRFYPTDDTEGWIVYEGDRTDARDRGEGEGEGTRYYTVFTYDDMGNISSGAVVHIHLGGGLPQVDIDPTMNDINIQFKDIQFIQEGIKLPVTETGGVNLDGSRHFTIAVPYEIVPPHLKAILVTVIDPVYPDLEFKFLLKINKEKTFYESKIAPFGRSGVFQTEVVVFDFKTAQVGYTKGTLNVALDIVQKDNTPLSLLGILMEPFRDLGSSRSVWFFLILLLGVFIGRRFIKVPTWFSHRPYR